MVLRAMRLIGAGVVIGIAVDRLALELGKPAADQFPGLRARMNAQVNPWLMEHGIPGSESAEIATLEHIGRTSGSAYFTPVHPTLRGDSVLVPAPMGVGSQWARNVLHAGGARMQLHDRLYELDRPELVTVSQSGMVPRPLAAPFDRMGWRYVRFHVVASAAATFGTHGTSVPAGRAMFDDSLAGPVTMPMTIPREPRLPTREPAPA